AGEGAGTDGRGSAVRPGLHGWVRRLMSTQLAPVAADLASAATRPYRTWTPTAERYLLALVAEGRTHQQIGRRLGTSSRAITHQMVRIFRRLDAVNAPHAV